MEPDKKICVGKIIGPHGLRGLVKLQSYTQDPDAIAAYSLCDSDGKAKKITLKTPMGSAFIAEIEGVASREAAEKLKGLELFTDRGGLPPTAAREYYLADLIGLRVEDHAGNPCGQVLGLHDFGGGINIEIALPGGRKTMLPFRDVFVPVVDIAQGRVVIAPPDDWLEGKP